MEQKQNSLETNLETENAFQTEAKKLWQQPELRIMPVPGRTQSGKLTFNSPKENSLYNKKS